MSWKCLFGHQWDDGCECKRCYVRRDKWHMWNGTCKCKQCGKLRNEEHEWKLSESKCIEKCTICGRERSVEHKWNGCKCERCGEKRNVGHKWKNDKCVICGKDSPMCPYYNPKKFNGYCNAYYTIPTGYNIDTYCKNPDGNWIKCPTYVQHIKDLRK